MKEDEIPTIYSDGIGKIHFFGNMLRLDLMNFVPVEGENGKPVPQVTARLVMNPNAFLASYESFLNMIEKLTKAGVLSPVNNSEEEQPTEEKPLEEKTVITEDKPVTDDSGVKVEDVK